MKKIKVCFVTEDFYPEFIGGQGIYGYNLVSNLAKMGCKVTVLAEDRKGRKQFWQNKKHVQVFLTPFCFGNQLLLALFEFLMFKFRLNDRYFDILHANQLSGLFFVLFKPKNVGKIVVSVHNTNYDMAQKTESKIKRLFYQPLIFLERIVYQKADGLFFNSPQEEKELLNYYQIEAKSTKAVYPGVELPKFTLKEQKQTRIKVRENLGLPKETEIVLYIGRLVKRKKVDTLLKALKLLDAKTVCAVIIGKGREVRYFKSIAPKNVYFLGFVENTRPYFLASDCFVTVSVAEGGFLLSALEAASFGLPLILSPSAAGFPIIKEGINGFIVDADDPRLLAKKIRLVLTKSEEMGKNSKEMAKQFSWERCSQETVNCYQSLAEKH